MCHSTYCSVNKRPIATRTLEAKKKEVNKFVIFLAAGQTLIRYLFKIIYTRILLQFRDGLKGRLVDTGN